jgi:hypothetical protein
MLVSSSATKEMETATAGMSEEVGVTYALPADQTWGRYVPDKPDVSSLTQVARLEALLVLATQEGGTTWVFDA